METIAGLRSLADLPVAPGSLPVLGHLHHLQPTRMHLQLEEWCAQLGPLYTLRMGPRQCLVSSDLEMMLTAHRERPDRFRRYGSVEPVFAEIGCNSVFSVEGAAWRPQRALVMKALASTNFPQYFPTMHAITQRLHAHWREAAELGKVVDMLADLKLYTIDVTTALAFGEDPNTIEAPGDVIQEHLASVFPMMMARVNAPFQLWHYLKLPRDYRFDRSLAAVHRHVDGLIERARERMRGRENGPPTDLLEAMLQASELPDSGISRDDVAANVFILLLAGEDTTANSLAWTVYHLAQREGLQEDLHAQSIAALGPERVCPTLEGARRLDAFEAVVNESMRMTPVVPINPLTPIHDEVLGDLEVPAGTVIFFLTRPAMQDAANFGSPAEFLPQRWSPGHGQVQPHNGHAYLQFGAGPRTCPGRFLAGLEMRLVLSMLLRDFHVELAVSPSDIHEVSAFVMVPDRMPVRLTLRPNASR